MWLSLNDGVTGLAHSYPPNGDSEPTFDFLDVILSLFGQILEPATVADGLVPSWQCDVIDLDAIKVLKFLKLINGETNLKEQVIAAVVKWSIRLPSTLTIQVQV